MAWYLMFETGEAYDDILRDRMFYTASGTIEEVYKKILKHKKTTEKGHPWDMKEVKDTYEMMFESETEIVGPGPNHWAYTHIRLG